MTTTAARRALITGIAGQDGSYLAELLLSKGYEVHGLIRRPAERDANLSLVSATAERTGGRLVLHNGDMSDPLSLERAIERSSPDEVYNLGGQSHVGVGFEIPLHTIETIAGGTLALLEAIRASGRPIRFYQASTSEMFGDIEDAPQSEATRFSPRGPYGIAKVTAHHLVGHYRSAYGLHASAGIAFNHESPRRPRSFVTRKVTNAVAEIATGRSDELILGDLTARRDWGYAPEYVEAMWRMLQRETPGDYVLATGVAHSVRDLCETAFAAAGLDWQAYVRSDVRSDVAQMRPTETSLLVGNGEKAKRVLDWAPTTSFTELIGLMVEADLARLRG